MGVWLWSNEYSTLFGLQSVTVSQLKLDCIFRIWDQIFVHADVNHAFVLLCCDLTATAYAPKSVVSASQRGLSCTILDISLS